MTDLLYPTGTEQETDAFASAAAPPLGFPVVGIGASAGGLGALQRLFEGMPADAGLAYVVVLHLSPRHQSNVASILQGTTGMKVVEVAADMPIERDTVHVISPALELTMVDDKLCVVPLRRTVGRQTAIDVFFRTLAHAHRERAIAVLLSGTGSDGAVGITRIKEEGGVTLVQQPQDAEYDSMPLAAIDTGMVDLVLPVAAMPARLVDLWRNAEHIELPALHANPVTGRRVPPGDAHVAAESALHKLLLLLRHHTGHDFQHYKRSTVLRRIERRLQVNSVPTVPAYLDLVKARPEETAALLQDLLISVTHFFRDPEAFEALDRELNADAAADGAPRGDVRAWVAGCATGEEAFSIAMLLFERSASAFAPSQVRIFASDIDERAIARARQGVYPGGITADVSPERMRRFFTREGTHWRVTRLLRESVVFATHNLLSDPPFPRLDLVCCRNLLIYLDRAAQRQALEVFHFALKPGGLLFLGSSETAEAAPELFSVHDKKNRIYRANAIPHSRARPIGAVQALPLRGQTAALPPLPSIADRPALAQLHQRLVELHAPPSVLIDESANILHLTEAAARYLRFTGGTPTNDLLSVVRDEVRLELRAALSLAWRRGHSVQAREVPVSRGGATAWVSMSVRPLRDPVTGALYMLVMFAETEESLGADAAGRAGGQDPLVVELENELQRTRETLRGSIGQTETSNEELKAANEELQAINDELRATTEELETSSEELQSVNEELITVNAELKDKVEETGRVNDDLTNLISSTDIATLFVDRDLRIRRFTPRATDLFNIIASDIDRPLLDLTHRLDYPELQADVDHAFEALQLVEREVDGPGDRCYLARVLPYRTRENMIDGAVLTFVDISAARNAERRLQEGELHMRMVAESTRDYAILTTDAAGILTSWNTGAQLLFGHSAAQAVGQPIDIIFTPEDRAAGMPERELRTARETGRAFDERWHQHKDGSRMYCSGVVTPLLDGSTLRGYAKIARDMTDARRAAAEREQLLANEQQLRAELEEAHAQKNEFLAVMSHELKHPLNLIHVSAELLMRMPEVRSAPAAANAAGVIRRTVLGQAKIIDDLLDLSRMHTGKLSLDIGRVDWGAVVERVAAAADGDAQAKGLTLAVDCDGASAQVLADPVRVEQITWNLLSNALKFTPDHGRVGIHLGAEGAYQRLDVTDSGQGIDPAFLPHVFDMFRQSDSRTTRQQGGLGIGLALVRHLAELQGGRVEAASEGLGRGARFSVWLPRANDPADTEVLRRSAPALEGMRILVVDDAADTLTSFSMLLEIEGARVTACNSGARALEAAQRGTFDLVLSDIGMPVMDGYALIEALRRQPETKHVPAIALTGFGRREDERRALDAGFDAHLSKPVALQALLDCVGRLRTSHGPAPDEPLPGASG